MKNQVFRPIKKIILNILWLIILPVGIVIQAIELDFNNLISWIIFIIFLALAVKWGFSIIGDFSLQIVFKEKSIYAPKQRSSLRYRIQCEAEVEYVNIKEIEFLIKKRTNSKGREVDFHENYKNFNYLQIITQNDDKIKFLVSGFTKKQILKMVDLIEKNANEQGNPISLLQTKERIKDYSLIYDFKSEYKARAKELKEQEKLEKQQKEESGAIKTVMRPKGAVAVAFKIALPCIALGCFAVAFIPLGLKVGATIAVKVVVGLIGVGLFAWWGFSWKDKIAFGEKILYAPSLQGGTHKIKYANVQKVVYRMSGTGEDEIQTEDSFYIDVKTKSYEVCVTDYSEKQKVQFLSLLQKRMRACGNDLDLTSAWDSLGIPELQ